MSKPRQRAAAAFKVSGANVIQNQRTLCEMTFGQGVLDTLLTRQQPVPSVIELGLIGGLVQTEQGGQRGGGGIGMESTRRGQLGGGFQNAGDEHGDDQIALGARGAREERLKAQAAQGTEGGGHMAVGGGALNLEG